MELAGRVAVVTGGAGGIGMAMASRFADAGMRVVLADVEEPALREAEASLREGGADVLAVVTDVSSEESVSSLRDAAFDHFGTAHVLCNNAGVSGAGGLTWETEPSQWAWTFDVNLWGVVHGIRAFVPRLIEQGEGHVVNTASAAGLVSPPFTTAYNASKHAVVGISEAMLHELRVVGSEVGVSVLCPEYVRTRIAESVRNRPERYGGPAEVDVDSGLDVIRGLVEQGIDPDDVAREVLAAVRDRTFWIVTHPSTTAGLRERLRSIEEGRAPRSRLAEQTIGRE